MAKALTFSPEAARQFRQSRGNPIAGLVPLSLTNAINQFESGYLRQLVLIYDRLELGADPDISLNARKRRDSVAHLPWEIVKNDNLSAAEQRAAELHREALLHTFNNLTVLNAIEPEDEGEVRALVDNIMRAEFLRYDIHEKVFAPNGRDLDLELIHSPLAFWENTTGPLRYAGPLAMLGTTPADKEGFLVARRNTLAVGLSVCWMFGSQTLKDWLEYNAGFMLPGVHGKSGSTKGTEPWNDFKSSLNELIAQWVLVTGKDEEVEIIKADGTGGIAAQPLYEIMQRAKITLCLGSDLSTLSRRDSQGASVQGADTAVRIANDAKFVEDVINRGLVRQIVRQVFGPKVQPLAWFRLRPPMDRDDEIELKKDEFLMGKGVPFSIAQLAEKYGHSLPAESEELITPKPAAPEPAPNQGTAPTPDAETVANEAMATPQNQLRYAVRRDLSPLRSLLATALQEGRTIRADEWEQVTQAVMNGTEIEKALNAEWLLALITAHGGTLDEVRALIAEVTTPPNTETPPTTPETP